MQLVELTAVFASIDMLFVVYSFSYIVVIRFRSTLFLIWGRLYNCMQQL